MAPIREFLPHKHLPWHPLQPSQKGDLFSLSFLSSLTTTSTRAPEVQVEEHIGRCSRRSAPSGSPPIDSTSSILPRGDHSDIPPPLPLAFPPVSKVLGSHSPFWSVNLLSVSTRSSSSAYSMDDLAGRTPTTVAGLDAE
jgi:hypothetical protein